MADNPLESLIAYSAFLAEVLTRPTVTASTVTAWSDWYDDFPHPNDPTLAAAAPHHKHIPPDIKHHRVPAPHLSFEHPNLPVILSEMEDLGRTQS